jgi:hypothetical protein
MAVLDAKKTLQNLLGKGFISTKGDHRFLELYFKGKYILHTKISHGEKELESFHIGMMSRQCKLDKKDFIDLANCPLSAEGYVEILKGNGVISDIDVQSEIQAKSVNAQKRGKRK